jgi:hypothetical protein
MATPDLSSRHHHYCEAALVGELARVRNAANGGRNNALHLAACNLGELVGAGVLSADLACSELLAAAEAAGLGDGEALATIQSGLERGSANPRKLPEDEPAPANRVVRFTTWPSYSRPAEGRARTCTWEELAARVREPDRDLGGGKANLPLWSFASFRDGYRSGKHLERVCALAIDYDSHPERPPEDPARGNPGLDLATLTRCWKRWRRVVHTTASHKPDAARWRVFLFLSRPVDEGEYRRLSGWVESYGIAHGAPGLEADQSWHKPAQAWYVPARHEHYQGACFEGVPLDVDACLSELDAEEPSEPAEAPSAVDVSAWGWLHPDASWLEVEPDARRYLLHDSGGSMWSRGPGLLPRGKVALLAGSGGVGKTLALCDLALAVVTGGPWLGHFPAGEGLCRRVALLLGEEDGPELHRRLWTQAQARDLGAHRRDDLTRILLLPGAGRHDLALSQPEERGTTVATPAAEALRRFLEAEAVRNGEGWDLVVLDPLSRFAGPDVEVDNSAATRLIQVLEGFTALPGSPTVLMAHHLAKYARGKDSPADGAVGVRGASALVDGARWVGNLEPVFTSSGNRMARHARFQVSKSNYAAFPEGPLFLTRLDGGGLRCVTPAERERIEAATRKPKRERKRAGIDAPVSPSPDV